MRARQEIEDDLPNDNYVYASAAYDAYKLAMLQLEVLLDIRELLSK